MRHAVRFDKRNTQGDATHRVSTLLFLLKPTVACKRSKLTGTQQLAYPRPEIFLDIPISETQAPAGGLLMDGGSSTDTAAASKNACSPRASIDIHRSVSRKEGALI